MGIGVLVWCVLLTFALLVIDFDLRGIHGSLSAILFAGFVFFVSLLVFDLALIAYVVVCSFLFLCGLILVCLFTSLV